MQKSYHLAYLCTPSGLIFTFCTHFSCSLGCSEKCVWLFMLCKTYLSKIKRIKLYLLQGIEKKDSERTNRTTWCTLVLQVVRFVRSKRAFFNQKEALLYLQNFIKYLPFCVRDFFYITFYFTSTIFTLAGSTLN